MRSLWEKRHRGSYFHRGMDEDLVVVGRTAHGWALYANGRHVANFGKLAEAKAGGEAMARALTLERQRGYHAALSDTRRARREAETAIAMVGLFTALHGYRWRVFVGEAPDDASKRFALLELN